MSDNFTNAVVENGRKVATLVSAKQKPGRYKIHFDADELPSGIYIYTLTNGCFSQTKKMLRIR